MGLGLLRDGINEVIATTFRNAAPMGIICRDGTARIVMFRGSHTAENVVRDGWVVANFLFDPVVYVETAFRDLPASAFVEEDVGGKTMHRLAFPEAWAAYHAGIERETRDSIVVTLTLQRESVISPVLHPVNRGFNSIIEATIHATRYRRSPEDRLRDLIRHHATLVRRCGGDRELEALRLLYRYLEFENDE